jgi:hypothetical protein
MLPGMGPGMYPMMPMVPPVGHPFPPGVGMPSSMRHPEAQPAPTGRGHSEQKDSGDVGTNETSREDSALNATTQSSSIEHPEHDEALANLLLAWYYSGYYTGRYQVSDVGDY